MERRSFLLTTGACISAYALRSGQITAAAKPNIMVILADDLGYGDLRCQGCPDVPTPHIDSIAANGVRFTNGYSTHPVCSPSRAGLMSGRYQHRFGFEHNSGPERYAADNFGLPRSERTLAEALKSAGYATGMAGKWHIGFKEGLRPPERGFDFFHGILSGAHTYLPGNADEDPLYRNTERVTDEKEYLTDAFARESAGFIERSKDGPFFLYLAFNAVHAPLEATDPYVARFPGITDPKRRTYAGMLSAMDDAVGRVLGTLRANGLEENTLIFFYSDNGGPTGQTTSRNGPLRGFKGQVYEGGIRVPFMVQWKGVLPAGKVYGEMVMGFDVHATALAAAGAAPPEKPLDGLDLVPFLTGTAKGAPHARLFWRAGAQHAARVGDWKLVKPPSGEAELYNLREDIGERKNLAASNPEKLRELMAAYEAWDGQTMPAQWIRQDAATQNGGAGAGRRSGARPIQQMFERADANGDGSLNREEAPRVDLFGAMDADGNGAVTIEEARAYYRAQREE